MPSHRFRPNANARKLIRPFPYANILRQIPSHMTISIQAIRLVNLVLEQLEAQLLCDQNCLKKTFECISRRRIELLEARMRGLK